MRPGAFNLLLYRGDSYHYQFLLWTDETRTTPANLTGVTAEAEIRNAYAGLNILPLTCVVTLPNIIDMTLDAADWVGWANTSAVWDLQLTYTGGEVFTVLSGLVSVAPDVTDSSAIALMQGVPQNVMMTAIPVSRSSARAIRR